MKLTELNVTLKTIQEQLEKAEKYKAMVSKLQDIVGLYDDDLINEVIRLKDISTSITESKPSGHSIKEIVRAVGEHLRIKGEWIQSDEAYMDTDSYGDEVTITLTQGDQYDLDTDEVVEGVEEVLKDWADEEIAKAKAQEQEDKLRAEAQDDAEAVAEEESSDDE